MTIAPRPKRRTRPSLAARLRRFWILGLALFALVLCGGFAFARAPAFHLHDLRVTGIHHVLRSDVLARAAIDPHTNIWLLDRSAISRRIEEIPFVATARVHRRPLGNVWIEVAERPADGCVRLHGGTAFTVDRDARVLARACAATLAPTYHLRAQSDVPAGAYVRDRELAALQRDAASLTRMGDRVRALQHDAYGGLDADLQAGIRVRFGDDRDLDRKERLIGPILAQIGTHAGAIRALDLRAPASPVVEFRPAPPSPKPLPLTQYTQGTHRIHHNM